MMDLDTNSGKGGRVGAGGGLTPPGWQDLPVTAAPAGPVGPAGRAGPVGPAGPAGPAGGFAGGAAPSLLSAHKPGIIALRPLSLGDIYDGAVRVIRGNPTATVGLSLVVNLATLLPSAVVSVVLVHLLGQSTSAPARGALRTLLPVVVVPLFAQLAVVLLSGLLAYVVSEAVLGRKAAPAETWRAVRRRMVPLLGATVLVGLLAAVLPTAFLALAVWGLARHEAALVVVGLLLAAAFALVVLVPAGVVTALTGPAIVLEHHGPIAGVRRAIRLVRGGFWRLLGILLLTGLITGVASYLLRLPFSILGAVGASIAGARSPSDSVTVTVLASTLGYLVSGSVVTPFASAVACLLYVDRRMRLEALDVLLIRSVQQEQDFGPAPLSPAYPAGLEQGPAAAGGAGPR